MIITPRGLIVSERSFINVEREFKFIDEGARVSIPG